MHPCIHAAMHPCIHPSIHPSIRQWRLIGNSYKQDDPSSVNCQCFSEGHVQITFKFGGFPFAAPGWAVCSFCWSFGIASHRNMLARSTFEISSSTLRWPPGCWRVALLGTWGWPPQRSFIVYRYSISGDYPDFITHEMMINPCLYIYICVCMCVCKPTFNPDYFFNGIRYCIFHPRWDIPPLWDSPKGVSFKPQKYPRLDNVMLNRHHIGSSSTISQES